MGWVFGRGFDSRLVHKKTEWRFALLRFFLAYGNRTRRERVKRAEGERPVDVRRRRGVIGGVAAGAIPAWSIKKRSGALHCSVFFMANEKC